MMPEFVTKRWYRSTIVLFIILLCFLLSMVHWIFYLVGFGLFPFLGWMLYRSERLFRKDLHQYVLNLTRRIHRGKQFAIHHFPIGILLYDDEKRIEWHNTFVERIIDQKKVIGFNVWDVFPNLKEEKEFQWEYGEAVYQVTHFPEKKVFYFQEVTKEVELGEKYQNEQTVLGYIYLDNFEEIGQELTEQDETLLINQIHSKISSWAHQYGLAIKRYEEDKVFFVTRKKELLSLIDSKFNILEEIRNLTVKNHLPVTLSIGVSCLGDSMVERSQNALSAVNVALARGGDQAAVQTEEKMVFFGGKTNAVEKRTRVRARVVSHAISNLFRDHKKVIIMGHRDPDMDALGAAIGIAKFASVHHCQVKVIVNEENASIERLVSAMRQHQSLKDLLTHSEKVYQWLEDPHSLLVLVDTHRPSLAIDPELVERAKKVVVIDHHRRGEEFVEDPVLVYIEPYASSTCELVTELLQYEDKVIELDSLEASALLAGIVVDTKNFAFQAGVRTFEAASFLRRQGADLSVVQSLLKEDLERYIKRAELIKKAELWFNGEIAIVMGAEEENYDQLLIAQTADTLLNMQGVKASFVIGRRENHMISISARSEGEINVQVIMEKLGGGGHFTNAAIQMEGESLLEAKQQLLTVLKETLNGKGERK